MGKYGEPVFPRQLYVDRPVVSRDTVVFKTPGTLVLWNPVDPTTGFDPLVELVLSVYDVRARFQPDFYGYMTYPGLQSC